MKKQYPVLILLTIAITAVWGVFGTACGSNRLATPTDVRIEEDYLQWNKVDGADAYLVSVNDQSYVTHNNKFDLLDVTTDYITYKISVLAMNNDSAGDSLPSKTIVVRPKLVDGLFNYSSVTVNKKTGVMVSINSDIADENIPEKLIIPAFTPDGSASVLAVGRLSNRKTKTVWMPSSVEAIFASAFSGCTALERIKLSQNVTSIAGNAFYNCKNLKSIDLPNKLSSMTATAFNNCSSLKEITLPASLKTIDALGSGLFSGCESLEKIEILQADTENPGPYVSKDGCVIANNTTLIKAIGNVTIPDTIETIYYYAFDSNKDIKELTLPDSVKTIASGAFNNCTNLEKINLGKVEQFSSMFYPIFADCSSLKTVTFPATTTDISYNPFKSCVSLTSVQTETGCKYTAVNNFILDGSTIVCGLKAENFPSEASTIGSNAFSYSDIEETVIPEGIELSMSAFRNCYSLKKVTLPQSMKVIPADAFSSCYNLETVIFPQNLTQINAEAFSHCYKLTVTLPKNVSAMLGTFFGCTVYMEESFENNSYSISGSGSIFASVKLAKDNNVPYVSSYTYISSDDNSTFYTFNNPLSFFKNSGYRAVPYREGYEFMGWKTSENGEVVYKPYTVTPDYGSMTEYKACITDEQLATIESGTVLYAEWKKI